MKGMERRFYPVSELRVQRGADDTTPRIRGHAAVFNSLSLDLGGFRELIAPGAFAGALESDVRALFNHDPNFVLGRTKSGTLSLTEDETGLLMDASAPDTQWARDLVVSIERGDISQMSFGFRTRKDAWEQRAGEIVRTLLEVDLFDVSPVTFPAYTDTDVAVRSLAAARRSGAIRAAPAAEDKAAKVEIDFMRAMIEHHEMAISMVEELLAAGVTHSELRTLGEGIITAQSAEIEQLKAWLNEWYSDAGPKAGGKMKMRGLALSAGEMRSREALARRRVG